VRRLTGPLVRTAGTLALALLPMSAGAAAADAAWKVHQDPLCGIELKYPPAYTLEASGAREFCALWMRIGVREPRGLRAGFSLEIREMDGVERTEAARSGRPPTARDFALRVATNQCMADGPDGSTSCTNGHVRSTFRTAQGFHGVEIHLTEVRETFDPKKIEKRPRGPIFALDLSDDEVVRVLMAQGDLERATPGHVSELRAILDTLRVWTRARRQTPRVVEMQAFLTAPHAFAVRVVTGWLEGAARVPPSPLTSWLLTDPRGRRLGRDPATGAWHAEAPAVTHSSAAESGFVLREPLEGRYALQVTASRPSVRYQVVVQAPDRAGRAASARHAGRTAEPGAADRYEIVYAPAAARAVTLAEVPDFSRLSILLSRAGGSASPGVAEALLTDPRGRPAALDVHQPIDGAYTLRVTGTAAGAYTLDLRAWDRSGASVKPELRDVPTAPGVVHLYRLDYAATAKAPLRLGGGFAGDRLLAFANPTRAETRLAADVRSIPLLIFYGATIKPVSFSAVLNGDNVSGRFTPGPDGHEIVRIPLVPGVNTLVLSVEGAREGASDRAAPDTHRLVFRVE